MNTRDALKDWKYEVENGDTVLGFEEWCRHQRERDEYDDKRVPAEEK